MNIYQTLAIATAGVALSLSPIGIKPARAATITDNFTVDVTAGALAGQKGSGFFSYDDSTLTGSGLETVSVQSLSFSFLGNTYTQSDDYFSADGYPKLDLNNSNVVGLNYTVNYSPKVIFQPADLGSVFSISGTPVLFGLAGGATFYEGVPDTDNKLRTSGKVTYVTATVPEASSVVSTLAFGILSAISFRFSSRTSKCC